MSKNILIKKFLDISDSIEIILKRINKVNSPEDFKTYPDGNDLYDAILMRLQMIGEVLKKIEKTNPEILTTHTAIEWNKIIGLRNVISHDYLMIDEDLIYSI